MDDPRGQTIRDHLVPYSDSSDEESPPPAQSDSSLSPRLPLRWDSSPVGDNNEGMA